MYRENYIHNKQDEAFEQYRNGVMFQESVERVNYREEEIADCAFREMRHT